jgi:hypothetical protein
MIQVAAEDVWLKVNNIDYELVMDKTYNYTSSLSAATTPPIP